MTLKTEQEEEIKEVYGWGYFMDRVIKFKQDAGSYDLTEEDILLLIEAENNLSMFSNYEYENNPCEMCGSHGQVSVRIGNKKFIFKEW